VIERDAKGSKETSKTPILTKSAAVITAALVAFLGTA
jgi:hypothetical protein